MPGQPILKPTQHPPPDLLEKACRYRWTNPGCTWEATAKHVGRSRLQLLRWHKSPAWPEMYTRVGQEFMEMLAPAAARGLVKGWSRGNSAGAVEVLRSFGLLQPAEVKVSMESPVMAVLAALADLPPEVKAMVADRLDRMEGADVPLLAAPTVIDAVPAEMAPPLEVDLDLAGLDDVGT